MPIHHYHWNNTFSNTIIHHINQIWWSMVQHPTKQMGTHGRYNLMPAYIQRLKLKPELCSQCGNGCEDFDKYFHEAKNCLQRQKEKKQGVIMK